METEKTTNANRKRRKVYYKHARRKRSNIWAKHPVINISGKYLEKFGFYAGDDLEVSCEQGRIVITKLWQ